MVRGFVLLELMISFLIGSIMAAGLLNSIMQMSRVQISTNSITGIYGRIAVLQNQMERDLTGAFVPAQIDLIQTTTVKKDQTKPVEKIFYGTSKGDGGRMDLLTFITSSPLEIFFGVKKSKPKPRVARVVYRLVPDGGRKGSYTLMRQEGTSDLKFDRFKEDATGTLRSFAMVDGIQNLTVDYVTIELSKKDDELPKRTFKAVKQWDSKPKEQEKKKKSNTIQREPVKLPNQLQFTVSLWDSTFESTRQFQFAVPIAYKATEYEQPPEQPKEDKKTDKKESKAEAQK